MINPKNNSVQPNPNSSMRDESSSKLQQSPSPADQKTTDTAQQQLKFLSLGSPNESEKVQHSPKALADFSDYKSTTLPLTLQALADANGSSQKIANRSKAFLELLGENQPKTTGDDIDKLTSTEPELYEVLKRLQSQTESLPLPSIDVLRTQWMISKVSIATAIAQIFMKEPDREKIHNFVTMRNICAGVYNMIREKEGDAHDALEIVDVQSKFQALNQLMSGLAQESKANPSPALSHALPRILSQVISYEDLQQVRQYSELV